VLKAEPLMENYDCLNGGRERLWYAEHTNEKKRRRRKSNLRIMEEKQNEREKLREAQ
jgi:hypothetical protein